VSDKASQRKYWKLVCTSFGAAETWMKLMKLYCYELVICSKTFPPKPLWGGEEIKIKQFLQPHLIFDERQPSWKYFDQFYWAYYG